MSSDKTLPSFREQLAVVYDDYMDTLGGGERSALAYAKALRDMEFSVEIVSRRDLPSPSVIERIYGPEYADIPMRKLPTQDITAHLLPAQLSVFVNHTFMSFDRNPARLGLYSMMFPVTQLRRESHPGELAGLQTYKYFLCNSSFTKHYTESYWQLPAEKCLTMHPPISQALIDSATAELKKTGVDKKKTFINVARFNPGTHNKNQLIIIECFLEAKSRFPELSDWHLKCIGIANTDEASKQYLDKCLTLAAKSGGSVEILNNVNATDLKTELHDAFGYVHATGAFIPPGFEPHKCEHFGLSIIEAMAQACIPLVYARGGIFDVLKPGESGIPYITQAGLIEGFGKVASLWKSEAAKKMQQNALTAASELSQAKFTAKLAAIIAKGLNT